MKEFKYKATFEVDASLEKRSFKNLQASASVKELKDLRTLLPSDEYMKEHDDLLFCSFNLAVAGMINKNNHGILPKTAERMMKYWVNRPLNIEHDRSNTIGCIINTGFSTFGENKIITVDEALKSGEPFNLCMGGVVWKVVDPYFAEYLEMTNKYTEKDNYFYGKVATSWEVGFDKYVIAKGSKNLFNAEIVTDEKEIERLSPFLTQFGGTGFDKNNVECYLVISGDARPLGGGFTENPAAPVKSVFIPDLEEEEEKEEEPDDQDEMDDSSKKMNPSEKTETKKEELMEDSVQASDNSKKIPSSEKNIEKSEKIISQNKKITVRHINDMKFKDINDFCDKYAEASAKQEVFAASEVREFIQDQFVKEAEGWKSKVTEQEELAKASNEKVSALETDLATAKQEAEATKQSLDALRAELAEIRANTEKAEKEAKFNARMSELDEKYSLDEKTRKKLAKDIFGYSDEEYASYLAEDGDVILAGKEKGVADSPEKALKEVKASADFIPNAGSDKEPAKDEKKSYKATVEYDGRNAKISLS